MKGEKAVTTLLPYGAEKPRSGMTKSSETNAVEIFWDVSEISTYACIAVYIQFLI